MASVCCFVKPSLIGVPLKHYLSCDVRQKCIFKVNPGVSIFSRNTCSSVPKKLHDFLTYNRSLNCIRGSIAQPKSFVTPLFSSSCSDSNFQHPQKSSPFHNFSRNYSTSDRSNGIPPLLELSDLPVVHLPNPFKTIRNWFLSTFIIKMHLDKEFDALEFSKFATKAVQIVCARLSQSNYSSLEGLLTDKLLARIQAKLETLSTVQKSQLFFDLEDVIFQFMYEIGIIFDEDTKEEISGEPKRFVEITLCYQISKDNEMLQNVSAGPFPGPIDVKKASENIHLLNCRFIREYTKGVEDQWTINGFNYIKVADLMREVEQGKM